jgi:ketosteroid isomerase-like protein
MSAEANIESAKKGYAAFAAADVATAMANLSDDIEWIMSGESALSGTYRGKAQVGELWATIAEKSYMTSPQRFLADDDIVVVLSNINVQRESAEQVDVLTYRDGKVVQFRSMSDIAMQERVYGHK